MKYLIRLAIKVAKLTLNGAWIYKLEKQDYLRFTVPSKRILQEISQFTVAIWDVRLLFGQSHNNIAKVTQAPVDIFGFS